MSWRIPQHWHFLLRTGCWLNLLPVQCTTLGDPWDIPFALHQLQNVSLSVEARVEALLQQLTPQQKVAQLQSRPNNGIPELAVPAFNWQASSIGPSTVHLLWG